MVFLQETKLKEDGARIRRGLWGNESVSYVMVESDGSSGGLISCWRNDFFVVENQITSQRYVLLIGTTVGGEFRCGFGNIYAPNNNAERREFFSELQRILSDLGIPWCL